MATQSTVMPLSRQLLQALHEIGVTALVLQSVPKPALQVDTAPASPPLRHSAHVLGKAEQRWVMPEQSQVPVHSPAPQASPSSAPMVTQVPLQQKLVGPPQDRP